LVTRAVRLEIAELRDIHIRCWEISARGYHAPSVGTYQDHGVRGVGVFVDLRHEFMNRAVGGYDVGTASLHLIEHRFERGLLDFEHPLRVFRE